MKINKEFKKTVRPLLFILFLCCALLSCSLNNVLLDIISNYIQDPIESFIGDYSIFQTRSLSYIYLGIKESIIPFIGMILSVLSLIYLAVFQLLNKQKSKTLIASVVFIFILMFLYICLFIYKYPIYYFSMFINKLIQEFLSTVTFDNTLYIPFLISFNLLELIISVFTFITYILVIVSSGIKKGLKTVLTILISFLFVLLIIKFACYIFTYVVYIIHLNTNTPFPWQSNTIALILSITTHAFEMLIYHGCAIYMFIMFIKSKEKMMIAYILPYVFSAFACVVIFFFRIVFSFLYVFLAYHIVEFIYQSLIF